MDQDPCHISGKEMIESPKNCLTGRYTKKLLNILETGFIAGPDTLNFRKTQHVKPSKPVVEEVTIRSVLTTPAKGNAVTSRNINRLVMRLAGEAVELRRPIDLGTVILVDHAYFPHVGLGHRYHARSSRVQEILKPATVRGRVNTEAAGSHSDRRRCFCQWTKSLLLAEQR